MTFFATFPVLVVCGVHSWMGLRAGYVAAASESADMTACPCMRCCGWCGDAWRVAVHKAHREELECVLGVLERVLILLPELLARRWQCHSLSRIMAKLLHPANSWKLRREAIRLVSIRIAHRRSGY